MYQYYNPNPAGRSVGDCAIRAIAKALGIGWEEAYAKVIVNGFRMNDMPSSDSVWGSVLRMNGFYRTAVPNTCPDCYTIEDFCEDNPEGTFVLGTGTHTATVMDGILFDSWNSLMETPIYVWFKDVQPVFRR